VHGVTSKVLCWPRCTHDLLKSTTLRPENTAFNCDSCLFQDKVKGLVETTDEGAGKSVVKKAEEVGADMIVTGTRGLGTIRRTVLGSVSDYIVHHAKVPVAICHM